MYPCGGVKFFLSMMMTIMMLCNSINATCVSARNLVRPYVVLSFRVCLCEYSRLQFIALTSRFKDYRMNLRKLKIRRKVVIAKEKMERSRLALPDSYAFYNNSCSVIPNVLMQAFNIECIFNNAQVTLVQTSVWEYLES